MPCAASLRLTIILVFVCRCHLCRGSCSIFDRYNGQNLAVRQPTEIRLRRRQPQLQRLSAILPAGQLAVFPLRYQPHAALGMLLHFSPRPGTFPDPAVSLFFCVVFAGWVLRSTGCSREAGIPSLVRVEASKQRHFVFIVLFYFFFPKRNHLLLHCPDFLSLLGGAPTRTGAAQARREIARTFSQANDTREGKSTKAKIEGRRRGVPQSECTMSLQFFISSDINLPVAIKMYLSRTQNCIAHLSYHASCFLN